MATHFRHFDTPTASDNPSRDKSKSITDLTKTERTEKLEGKEEVVTLPFDAGVTLNPRPADPRPHAQPAQAHARKESLRGRRAEPAEAAGCSSPLLPPPFTSLTHCQAARAPTTAAVTSGGGGGGGPLTAMTKAECEYILNTLIDNGDWAAMVEHNNARFGRNKRPWNIKTHWKDKVMKVLLEYYDEE